MLKTQEISTCKIVDEENLKKIITFLLENDIPLEYLDYEKIYGGKVGLYTPTKLASKVNESLPRGVKKATSQQINKMLKKIGMQDDEKNPTLEGRKYITYEYTIIIMGEKIKEIKTTFKWTSEIIPHLIEQFTPENDNVIEAA
jgi:predicted transcriptional regulator